MANHCSDEDFIRIFEANGASETSRILGINVRSVYFRRISIEKRKGITIVSPNQSGNNPRVEHHVNHPKRLLETVHNGIIMVGSDCHYWPGIISPAHRGFVYIQKKLKPVIVILNGDLFDGVQNGRHARIGWARGPNVREELEAVKERTDEIREASPDAKLFWPIGNHDLRFDTKLSEKVPEYEGTAGFSLADHFPHWSMCVAIWINDEIVIKHRFKGGVHATHNNTVTSGKTMVTGHLHSLKVTPYNDYNGTRFGVDTGTMADPDGPQFQYDEDNPKNHRSGFIVLTIRDGELLWPEICRVVDENHIEFRGEIIKI